VTVGLISQNGRITAAHGRFNGIRQVAPACTHLIQRYSSLGPPESTTQTASHFCTAHGICLGMTVPIKIAPTRIGRSGPPSDTWFIGRGEVVVGMK